MTIVEHRRHYPAPASRVITKPTKCSPVGAANTAGPQQANAPVQPQVRPCAALDRSLSADAAMTPEDYRSAMRQIPAAVAVVTTSSEGGRQGLTVTAMASVSAEPPQLLICINGGTRSAAAISAAGFFGVNYLDSAHVELAEVFAAPTDDHQERFGRARWFDSPTGTPLLTDALIAFDCKIVSEIHSGTHIVFIGQVTGVHSHDGRPLLYERGAFTTTAPSPVNR